MTPPRITVVVVDDHWLIRSALSALLRSAPGFEWVGEAASGGEAIELVARVAPDVVLMDLQMPDLDGVESTRLLLQRWPQTKVVMISGSIEAADVQRALRAGAVGYASKTASATELAAVMQAVCGGRTALTPDVGAALAELADADAPGRPIDELTPRELEVLQAMARGHNNAVIAEALQVSVATVKFHITHVLRKLQVESRTEAVVLALKHRWVGGPAR